MRNFKSCPLTVKLSAFDKLTDVDLAVIDRLHRQPRSFLAGREIVHQGQADRAAYVLLSGWACSFKLQRDGTRQIVDIQIPGDFLGFRSISMQTSSYGFEPIVDLIAVEVPKQFLIEAFATSPKLAAAIMWATSRDAAIGMEHIVRLGRRDATVRIAHFLLELKERLSLVGLGSEAGYMCPLTQYHLADTLGLSAVHVNRILRDLREAGLVSFRGGEVKFLNLAGLTTLAGFNADYLDQTGSLAA